MDKIANFFEFKKLKTNFKTEILAGLTTYISMVYIMFVTPGILQAAGMNKGAVFTATALASAIGCILMGVLAKYPIASAPALGITPFFAYSVVVGMKIPWQTALAGVFVASLIFVAITVFKLREMIINAIPADLKYAISAGIGLFIAFLGLSEGGLIVKNKDTLVSLGTLSTPTVWVTIFGFIVTLILMLKKVPGAIFVGMILSTVFGLLMGIIKAPHQFLSTPPSIQPTFMKAFEHVGDIHTAQMWVVVLTFLLVTLFDTAGTLVALATQAGFMKDNKMPRVGKALLSDSTAMLTGSLLGTPPVGAFVESSAGIAVGGRSGFTAVVTGIMFIFGIFLSPMLTVVTSQVTAPALIIVGVLMAQQTKNIHWEKLEIAVPSFLVLIGMPLTYSISDGIALGFIIYPISMLAAKRGKEVHPLMYALMIIFIVFLIIIKG